MALLLCCWLQSPCGHFLVDLAPPAASESALLDWKYREVTKMKRMETCYGSKPYQNMKCWNWWSTQRARDGHTDTRTPTHRENNVWSIPCIVQCTSQASSPHYVIEADDDRYNSCACDGLNVWRKNWSKKVFVFKLQNTILPSHLIAWIALLHDCYFLLYKWWLYCECDILATKPTRASICLAWRFPPLPKFSTTHQSTSLFIAGLWKSTS